MEVELEEHKGTPEEKGDKVILITNSKNNLRTNSNLIIVVTRVVNTQYLVGKNVDIATRSEAGSLGGQTLTSSSQSCQNVSSVGQYLIRI